MLNKIEKLLQNNLVLKIIAFLIALVAFLIISQSGSPWWRNLFQQSEVINNVIVTTNYDQEKYYISGLPDRMPINISGSENNLITAKNQSNAMRVYIDLSNYDVGKYTINSQDMKFNVPPGVKASSVVEEFNISVQKKATQDYGIELNYIDPKNTTGFIFSNPKLEKNFVTITGGDETLSSIASVQAIVDLSQINLSNNNGTSNINAKLVPYNKEGNIVEEISLSQENVNLSLDYKVEAKEIPINYQFIGEEKNKYVALICPTKDNQVCNINSQSTVKIFGDSQKIKELTDKGSLIYSIDLSKLDKLEGQVEGIPILPAGVFVVDGNTKTFDVKLGPGVTKTISGVSLQTSGLNPKFSIKAVDAKEGKVDITVTGANDIINGYTNSEGKVIEGLNAQDIQAYLDLSQITSPGSYDVPILINQTKPFSYTLSNQNVHIQVVEES